MKARVATLLAMIVVAALSADPALAEPVDVNTADAETIASALDGIGITKARAIVAYRNANGPFTSVESLAEVTGIGTRTIEANRSDILLGDAADDAADDAD